MNTGEIAALRMQLVLGGFWPLPLNGKIPFLEEWPKLRASTADIRSWGIDRPDARNTGILTETTPTLDLDILNEEAVRACEERVREHYEEKGNILVRIGLPPKCAIPFRTDDPFEKITVNVIAPNGKTEKIEFLGSGQQVVVDGLHPDTGKPYAWFGGDPWHVKREDLPYIHPAEAQQLVNDLIDVLVQEFGYTRIRTEEQAQTPAGDTEDATDLCDALSSFSPQGRATLHEISRIMGLPGKPKGFDGGEVERHFHEGKIKEIADYCQSDVVNTYRLWLRYELFRGRLSDATYSASELLLGEFVKAHERRDDISLPRAN